VTGQHSTLGQRRAAELAALRKVQRRVAAIGFFAVAVHGVIGLIVASGVIVDQGRHSDATVLIILSGIIAAITCIVTRAILGARPLAAVWLLVSLIPSTMAAFRIL
jgi:hypothetical protein